MTRRLVLVVVLPIILACACGAPAPQLQEIRGETMGTYYSVKYWEADAGEGTGSLRAQLEAALEEVNDQMSTYREGSELSRFNRHRGDDWFPVSAATARVVSRALEVNRASSGAFDVTAGALVKLWSFGPGAVPRRVPSEDDIAKARGVVGAEMVEVGVDGTKLRKSANDVYVDLSAIAKGFGVDRLGEVLEAAGVSDYLVDIGGDMFARGRKPDGSRWKIAIERPEPDVREIYETVDLGDAAIATSGDYRNFFEQDGVRYSHTIDPRTGRPVHHGLASVSVIAADCMSADAWATALLVLGDEAGPAIAEKNGLAAFFISRADGAFRVQTTSAFDDRVAGTTGGK